MPTRPLAVAFDVLETLLDLQPLHDQFAELGQPTQLLQPWVPRRLVRTTRGPYGDVFTPPDVTVDDLEQVAEGLLALPED